MSIDISTVLNQFRWVSIEEESNNIKIYIDLPQAFLNVNDAVQNEDTEQLLKVHSNHQINDVLTTINKYNDSTKLHHMKLKCANCVGEYLEKRQRKKERLNFIINDNNPFILPQSNAIEFDETLRLSYAFLDDCEDVALNNMEDCPYGFCTLQLKLLPTGRQLFRRRCIDTKETLRKLNNYNNIYLINVCTTNLCNINNPFTH
ncbi:hypothetical protein SNEBB_005889 [Seison nebaliae]|nr:hypothetical protein SNEBB_005889 [Seison nebaliae]